MAPSRVEIDLGVARALEKLALRTSGLVYANRPACLAELRAAAGILDRVDLLMPLSARREPAGPAEKRARLVAVLEEARSLPLELSAGFPHAFTAEPAFLLEIARAARDAGARRITVYDTNGSAEPFSVFECLSVLVEALSIPVFFHGHDDLGLATANSWAAVRAGAAGLDVTVNGLGDRAGNASLEQLAALLHLRGVETGVRLDALPRLSRLVERLSGVGVSPLAPVVGAYVFAHRSPSHLHVPAEFEAIDPGLLGARRRLVRAPKPPRKRRS